MSESEKGESLPTWATVGFIAAGLVLAWRGLTALNGSQINSGPMGADDAAFLPPLGWVVLIAGFVLGVAGLIVKGVRR